MNYMKYVFVFLIFFTIFINILGFKMYRMVVDEKILIDSKFDEQNKIFKQNLNILNEKITNVDNSTTHLIENLVLLLESNFRNQFDKILELIERNENFDKNSSDIMLKFIEKQNQRDIVNNNTVQDTVKKLFYLNETLNFLLNKSQESNLKLADYFSETQQTKTSLNELKKVFQNLWINNSLLSIEIAKLREENEKQHNIFLRNPNPAEMYCSDLNNREIMYHSRVCVYKNVCISKREGAFVRKIKGNELEVFENQYYSQLSSYIHEGSMLYWRPKKYNRYNYSTIEYRKNILLYAPAAWPQKMGFHFLMNNIFPVFRILDIIFPDRMVKYPAYNDVWKYNVDILSVRGGHAGDCHLEFNNVNVKWLGINNAFCSKTHNNKEIVDPYEFDSRSNNPNDTTMICYENFVAGTGGFKGHWSDFYKKPEINVYSKDLLNNFRTAFLQYSNSCNPHNNRQLQLTKPLVVFTQRSNESSSAYGNRIITNIKEVDEMLFKMKKNGTIDYNGVVVYSAEMTQFEQACIASKSSIFIGVHGNQLAWGIFMESKTVMLELNPIGDIYKSLSYINNVFHYTMNVKCENVTIGPLQTKILEMVTIWKKNFNII